MTKNKSRFSYFLVLSLSVLSYSAAANSDGFLSSKIDSENTSNKINLDRKYQFLLKKMFRVDDIENDIFSRKSKKGAALRYLNRYQGQGRFTDEPSREMPVNNVISKRVTKDTFSSIQKQIKENLKDRGYKNYSKKPKHVKSIMDYKRVTNSFFETSLRDALNEVSQQVNIPFLMDESVQGTVTVKLDNTPLDQALEMLLVSGGYEYIEDKKYLLFGFPQSSSPIFKRLSKTKVLHPVYMLPTQISELLSDDYKNFVKFSDPNNTIVITAQPVLLNRIVKDISKIDHRPAQMKLEVLIADVSTSAKSKIGRDFWNDKASGMGTLGGTPFGLQSSTDSGFTFNIVEQEHTNLIDQATLSTLGVTMPPGASVLRYFTGVFNAMEDNGEARVWATPSVVATDGKRAVIDIKTEQIIPIVSGPSDFLQVTTKNYETGVSMQIVPRISSNGEINLDIQEIKVSTVSFTGERQSTGDRLPVLTTRRISTNVSLANEETLVIGGLLDIQHGDQGKNFPGMKSTGALLGVEKQTRETRDLVIFITPTLLQEHSEYKKMESFL
jgi:type II secretory pathway component GspD/PulD (secretin)